MVVEEAFGTPFEVVAVAALVHGVGSHAAVHADQTAVRADHTAVRADRKETEVELAGMSSLQEEHSVV